MNDENNYEEYNTIRYRYYQLFYHHSDYVNINASFNSF